MQILTDVQVMQALAKATGKFCMYINIFNEGPEETFFAEVMKAAPYLNFDDHLQLMTDGGGIIVCDSKEEMEDLYEQTVGDDGPTKKNSYDGTARVYALTCSNEGVLCNENT